MHEIEIKNLTKVIDPMALGKEWAIAAASDGRETNGLTIGWASYGRLWNKPSATVYVHRTRYSKHIFDGASYFSICYMKPEDRKTLVYFGEVSGRDEDKMKNCGLTVVADDLAPYFAECRAVVICRIMGKSDFDPLSVDEGVRAWYDRDGVHTIYHGEIVKVLADEED